MASLLDEVEELLNQLWLAPDVSDNPEDMTPAEDGSAGPASPSAAQIESMGTGLTGFDSPSNNISLSSETVKGTLDQPGYAVEPGGHNPSGLMRFKWTHRGNAEALAAEYQDYLRYDPGRGWFAWEGTQWKPGAAHVVADKLVALARRKAAAAKDIGDAQFQQKLINWSRRSEDQGEIEAARKAAQELGTLRHTHWDHMPLFLGAPNGTIRLNYGKLLPSMPSFDITRSTAVLYVPEAECPRWEEFLDQVLDGDTEMIDFVQRAVGYTLTGDVSEKLVFFCHGPTDSGKSTFLGTLTDLFGEYGATKDFEQLLLRGRAANLNAAAGLDGVRLVVAGETRIGAVWDDAKLKNLTGGDPIEARHLYKEAYSYLPQFKIWLASNDLPNLRDVTGASIGRLALIRFPRSFKRNNDLAGVLHRELPGIFAWAVRGAVRWCRGERLILPESSIAQREDYREEQDLVAQFLAERTEPGGHTGAATLYKAFRDWCEEQGLRGYQIMSNTAFGRRLPHLGHPGKKIGAVKVYPVELRDWVGENL